MGGGVEGFEDQLCTQQLHTLHTLDQFAVLEGQTLGGLQAQAGTVLLSDTAEIRQVGLVGNAVFLNRTQQQRAAVGGLHGLNEDHGLGLQTLGDFLAGVDHLAVAVAGNGLGVRDVVELTRANDDLAENVVLLGHGDDARGLAEDVLHDLGAGLDPLTVFDHQQGDVLVDFVGLLGDPEQGAALVDLVAVLGATGLLDGQARGELDDAAGLGAEAVVGEFSNHLTVTDLGAGVGVEAITNVVLALEVPELTGMGGFTQQLAVLQGQARGDDLDFAGVASALTQANGTAVLAHEAAFGQHFTGGDLGVARDHRLGVGRQVVDVAAVHPHPAETLGLEGAVALAVSDLLGLNRVLVANLASQVADDVLGGLLHALLHGRAGRDLGQHRVGGHLGCVGHEQQRAGGDGELLGLAAAAGLQGQREVGLSDLGLHTVGGAEGANASLGAELNRAGDLGADHTRFGGGHTTGVEGPHGELGTRLTDGLGRDDADGFTQVHQLVVGQSPAVALPADRTGGFAGQG